MSWLVAAALLWFALPLAFKMNESHKKNCVETIFKEQTEISIINASASKTYFNGSTSDSESFPVRNLK